ncbi:MAG: hypothetical protein ABSE76_03185 [Minisyncoccia bacterium]|jgi:hypothetical protein
MLLRNIVLGILTAAVFLTPNWAIAGAQGGWQHIQITPNPVFEGMWEKRIGDLDRAPKSVCFISTRMDGKVHAELLLLNIGTDIVHAMEWTADSVAAAKDHQMRLRVLFGDVITDKAIGRDSFFDQCGNLPF